MNTKPTAKTLTRDELIARLKRFPAENDFTLDDETHFVHWCNGHCFFWRKSSEGWICNEL